MSFTVPGYEVGQLLGFGSHGQVWRGQVARVGTPVALKRITAPDSATARAARAEAALLSALSHPHLIELRECVVLENAVVLVLELADGGSLAELLSRRNRLTPAEVAASLSPVGAALAHAHNEGVLHGDVSASNVLFTPAGYPKLADLGVARMFGAGFDALGTPAYVDPVVAAGGAAGWDGTPRIVPARRKIRRIGPVRPCRGNALRPAARGRAIRIGCPPISRTFPDRGYGPQWSSRQ